MSKFVKPIQTFYAFLQTKDIPEEYRLKQLQKKFKLPMITIIWALEQK